MFDIDDRADELLEQLDRAGLDSVITVREVCHLYNKTHKTVTDLIKAGKLIGRQARFGSIWLVSKRSCDERWPDYGRS